MVRALTNGNIRAFNVASSSMLFFKVFACAGVIALGLPQAGRAQFNSPGSSQTVAPVSQAFTDGFMDGHRTMAMNSVPGHANTLTKARPSTGKGDLADASKDLRDLAVFVAANWDKADDAGRGKVAGEIEQATQMDQLYAMQLSKKLGIDIPNHTVETGYFSSPNHLNGEKTHALRLLTDTADQIDMLDGDMGPDKKYSKTGELLDNHPSAALIPGVGILQAHRHEKQIKEGVAVRSENQAANSIKSVSDSLFNVLIPTS